jgi:DNA topoisomerase-6 subunit A
VAPPPADKFWKDRPLLTCGGRATRGARRLIQRPHRVKLPIYVLVDNDPWGLYIYSVVARLDQSGLRIDTQRAQARYPGFDARLQSLQTVGQVKIDLLKEDITRAKQILSVVCEQTGEDHRPARGRFQMEIEALQQDISFVTDVYIPQKIAKKDWLV